MRGCLETDVMGGLGGTTNCGTEDVEGTAGIEGVEKDEDILLAASIDKG